MKRHFFEGAPPPILTDHIDLEALGPGTHRLRLNLLADGTGHPVRTSVIVVRSPNPGPVVGLTGAVHGNELNGIPTLHRLLRSEGVQQLRQGTLIVVPIVNIPAYLAFRREFPDGTDLNRIMPGNPTGNQAEQYAWAVSQRILKGMDYLVDLHTASFGRVNSFYVRADMTNPITIEMARRVRSQIIVHGKGAGGTVRRAAAAMGIQSITVEIGDPQRLQEGLIQRSRLGIQEILEWLGMIPDLEDPAPIDTVECHRSYWVHTDKGGMLEVLPALAQEVKAGDPIARQTDLWGDEVKIYYAPEDGVIVGKSTNPVGHAGARIIHLGIRGTPSV